MMTDRGKRCLLGVVPCRRSLGCSMRVAAEGFVRLEKVVTWKTGSLVGCSTRAIANTLCITVSATKER